MFGIAQPDTYPREIQRRRARRNNQPLSLSKAESGVTFKEMAIVTFVVPLKMLVSEPIVIGETTWSLDMLHFQFQIPYIIANTDID